MSLAPGSRIGPYEILGSIGAGGMGEVYRGRDTKLGRDVAIKILPANVSRDADRLARFEREARTLASLNHPNIAQVYGFEDGALVMELLEGETLRDRLRNGALPARKAIEYATQIARGLAAAHDRGVIHRDLKPENIFLLKDGQVKLLDFGLARPMETATSGATETVPAVAGTDPGTVLGTVGYMSPEQVRAEPVDARTDLFSLGAVLYEMLTGQRAFRRNTTAETMTAILREEPPDLSSSRADISPAIDRIVRHALEKNPLERFQTARDIAFAFDSLSGSTSTPFAAVPARSPLTRERLVWVALSAGLAAMALWLGISGRGEPATESASYQVNLALPDEIHTSPAVLPVLRLGVSPDGSTVAYAGMDSAGERRLWMVSLRTGSVRALDEAGMQPSFSPDGSQLLYLLRRPGSSATRRVALAGGPAETIADWGGYRSWGSDGKLFFSALNFQARILDPAKGASATKMLAGFYGMTSALPNGRFLAGKFATGSAADAVYVVSGDSGEATRLIDGAAAAWYAKGTLAFLKNDTVFAQRFDERSVTLAGQPVTITEDIEQNTTGGFAIAGSPSGTLVLQRPEQRGRSQLKWFRRDGAVLATVGEAAEYSNAELSPDGRRLLVSIPDPKSTTRDLYIVDLQRGVRQRFTIDPSDERSGVWSRDGQRIFYRSKGFDLYAKRSDFTGVEQPLVVDGKSKDPYSVSPDGKLVYRVSGEKGSNDIMIVPVDGKSMPVALQNTAFDENGGSFSPDGKSIVYQSDESGQMEVYVMSVGTGGGGVQLSTNGGAFARWVRSGKEILYLSADRALMSVPVRGSGSTFEAGTPQRLFQLDTPSSGGVPYDVTVDGQQIIAINSVEVTTRPKLTAIINWPALVPK